MGAAIVAEGLVKRYGDVRALDGLDLVVPAGTVLGVLGPNGAGKTTAVRVLTTLLRPDAGRAEVAGIDVLAHPGAVRRVIGLAGQNAAVDERLTGNENLVMFGRLYGLNRADAQRRSAQLLEQFGLVDAGSRVVQTYSGGMRRRLDLAGALVATPEVLFLDEPTTGLDPRGRQDMWEVIEGLVRGGTSLLLTTQYLEEADRLADSIAVVDHGRVIASGTSDELKDQVGGETIEIIVGETAQLDAVTRVLGAVGKGTPTVDEHLRRVSVPVSDGAAALFEVVRGLDGQRSSVMELGLHRPTLDDVFLALTGHAAEDGAGGSRSEQTATTPPTAGKRRGRR